MRRSASRWLFLILLPAGLVGPTCGCGGPSLPNETASVSPCALVAEPSKYDGARIRLTGFVTSTKEGAFVWEQGCRHTGVVLLMAEPVLRDRKFRDLISRYGLSDTPIRVTLLGTFRSEGLRRVKKFTAERVLEAYLSGT